MRECEVGLGIRRVGCGKDWEWAEGGERIKCSEWGFG